MAAAPTTDGRLAVTPTCAIALSELRWRVSTSGGPGGQHANRSLTRVEVRFDVVSSDSLDERQRQRLVERLGPVVRALASEHRSQTRNRDLALERLRSRLATGLHVEATRRPTRPGAGARERRLEDKHRQGQRKRQRRLGSEDA